MSLLDTKQALTTQLLNNLPSGLTSDDVAFENRKFNPKNKSLWLASYFIPASEESTGKTSGSSDEERGIYQVSVFVALNSDNFDLDQLAAIDEIKAAFRYNTNLVYNGQNVDILETSTTSGSESEAWFQRDLSINYLTFSSRD